jgi:outer membrane receptor for ferrienterochelin and colicin
MNRLLKNWKWQALPFVVFLSVSLSSRVLAEEKRSLMQLDLEDLVNVTVTTASKKQEKISEAPATVYVISKNDIRGRGYRVLSDVLRDLPGMETIENYFSELGTLVPVRGVMGNNKIVVLLNGVRLNPPGGEEMKFRNDLSIRSAEQIEIIYGPGSTLYGQDAISATINIITESPSDAPHGQILAGGGTNDAREGFVSFASPIDSKDPESASVSGYVNVIQSDLSDLDEEYPDWWQNYVNSASLIGRGTTPDRTDGGQNAFFKVEGETSSIQAWYSESKRSSSEGGYTPILQYVPEARWHDSSFVAEAANKMALTESAILESRLSFNRYEIDPETRYVFPVSPTELFLNDFKYGLGTGVTLEEKVNVEFDKDLSFIFGLMAGSYDIIPKATVPGGADTSGNIVSQAGSFVYYTEKNNAHSRVEVPRATDLSYENYSAYVEGSYQVLENVKVIGGARLDTNTRYTEDPFSPRASVVYTDPDHHFTAKYIFSKAFVAPAPYFAYNVFDNGVALNTINPDLEPERATSNEVNLLWNKDSWMVGASIYYNRQENLILVGDLALPANIMSDSVFVDEAGTQRRILTQTVNGGESTAKGFDLYAKYGSEQVALWSSYSFVDVESEMGSSSSGLPQISKHNIRFGLTYKLLDNLSMTPSLVFRSTPENVTRTFSLDDELKNPYELNAHIIYTPTEDLDLFLSVRNLTDNHYALRGLLGPTPQEPLSVMGGMRFTFD